MQPGNLNDYYDRWAKYCNDIEDDDVPKPPVKKPAVPKIDPKDIRIGFGEPMTEAEFKASRNNMNLVGSTRARPSE